MVRRAGVRWRGCIVRLVGRGRVYLLCHFLGGVRGRGLKDFRLVEIYRQCIIPDDGYDILITIMHSC